MVVNLVENTYPMCERYWPSRKEVSQTFGPVQVSILNEVTFSDYTERELEVCVSFISKIADLFRSEILYTCIDQGSFI